MSGKQLYKLYKSTNKNKKYDIYIMNPKTNRVKKISFGGTGYSDYTIHKNKERRNLYRIRHKNDRINDVYSSGYWSWWVLWGDSYNLNIALKTAVKKAKELIK
jgi:glutamine synthetase type III